MITQKQIICGRLQSDNARFIEIESKKRIFPSQAKSLKKHLSKLKNSKFVKTTHFFDQFLDTPGMDLFKLNASLRLRYKKNGTKVYLQYKGPGFLEDGLLYRSEFSSNNLKELILEESHHDIIQFRQTSVLRLLKKYAGREMMQTMKRHLGARVLRNITTGPIIALYRKDKFLVDMGDAFLEPSIDRVFAFHINKAGLHPVSTFYEFENEIKAEGSSLSAKLEHISELVKFNEKLGREFRLHVEPLDKYHRCASLFLASKRRKSRSGH